MLLILVNMLVFWGRRHARDRALPCSASRSSWHWAHHLPRVLPAGRPGGLGPVGLGVWRHLAAMAWARDGAVSALMGMYAVLYRLRRVRFFTSCFLFQLRHRPALAIAALRVDCRTSCFQHWLSGRGVAYMAHLRLCSQGFADGLW